jgi:hypothetical protein
MIQPGFRGCFPIELFNAGNNPVELVVGGRIFQTRLFALRDESDYGAAMEPRKYVGNVRAAPKQVAACKRTSHRPATFLPPRGLSPDFREGFASQATCADAPPPAPA